MGSENKQYAERDAYELDKSGGYYGRHVMAMTSEKLHAKSDIAAELGHRDMVIDQLRAVIGNPETVFLNMKRGTIAKPSLRCMIDLYGEVVNGDEAQLLEIAKLRAEVEALRKDAERYRWLRLSALDAGLWNDESLDAAMAAKEVNP